jgi:hypothetical protein
MLRFMDMDLLWENFLGNEASDVVRRDFCKVAEVS